MTPRAARQLETPQARIDAALGWLRATLPAGANLRADSRTLEPGDGFFAYAVDGADGRPYIADAAQRGARAVLRQADAAAAAAAPAAAARAAAPPAVPVLEVAGLDALAGPIAAGWYGEPSAALLVFGVTGTNGKTSVSHWIAQALTPQQPCAVLGTLGIGLPGKLVQTGFTTPTAPELQHGLAQLKAAGATAVAMEVSSHALHQGRVNGVAFDIAIFTNLTQDHLDYHGTMAAYELAKARLFQWPGLRAAVVNRDDAAGRRLLAGLPAGVRAISYGIGATTAPDALGAIAIRATAAGTAFTVTGGWGSADVVSATLGEFNVSNLLAVLGALLAADMPFDQAVAALAALRPVSGRMERMGGRLTVDEPLVVIDYAHTPDALDQTLRALRPVAAARGGALICVFGCGGDRDVGKRPLMGALAAALADQVVLTSDNPRSEPAASIIEQIAAGIDASAQPRVRRIEDRASAILQALRHATRADVVLLAGKGHESTQEVLGRKRPFDEHDHVRLALAARAATVRGDGE